MRGDFRALRRRRLLLLPGLVQLLRAGAAASRLIRRIGSGCYSRASLFNHSCSPNICFARVGREIVFFATRDIAAGEKLCINYIDLNRSLQERKTKLREDFGFDCNAKDARPAPKMSKASSAGARCARQRPSCSACAPSAPQLLCGIFCCRALCTIEWPGCPWSARLTSRSELGSSVEWGLYPIVGPKIIATVRSTPGNRVKVVVSNIYRVLRDGYLARCRGPARN